jgi:hypothetical protein
MGLMRFRVFPTERITEEMVRQAYLSGFDRESWPVRVEVAGDTLILERSVSDSGNLHVPWLVEGHGRLTLASGSLMERIEPYLLPLEIARGTIVQVRNQFSEWQSLGLSVPEAVPAKISDAVGRFSLAAVSQDDLATSADHAEAALCLALDAGEMMVAAFTEQAMAVRHRSEGKLTSLLGADLSDILMDDHIAQQLLLTFNAAQTPLCWREIETTEGTYSWAISDKQIKWGRANGLKVLGGPLLMLDPHALPDWLYLFEGDFDNLLDFISGYVRKVVQRYRGKVDAWICAGRVNAVEALSISEQERLRLIARIVELVQSLDPETPALVSFDQPWAEYMRQEESDFPPLHFADALIRAGSGVSGLMLEINVGYSPGGSLLRHPLEFNRLLDIWSSFGLPLWLSLCAPSSDIEDPLAQHKTTVSPGVWSAAAQQAWVARFVSLSLVKTSVQGVLWNQLLDSHLHEFPNGGLFDERGQAKPVLSAFAAIRQAHLK